MGTGQDHEYAVLGGFNRSRVGRYLFAVAATLSTAAVSALAVVTALLHKYGLSEGVPHVLLSVVSVGMIYLGLYWVFDRFAWRLPIVGSLLRVPDISGEWSVEGQTLNADKSPSFTWSGTIIIRQSWDKIRLRQTTAQSGSDSVAAALQWDDIDGCRLLYHYRNDPNLNEKDLYPHHGFGELTFAKDRQSARGEYFNGRGRNTFGLMTLTRLKR